MKRPSKPKKEEVNLHLKTMGELREALEDDNIPDSASLEYPISLQFPRCEIAHENDMIRYEREVLKYKQYQLDKLKKELGEEK